MQLRFLLLIAHLLLSSLSACIILPVEKGEAEHFDDEKLAFIEVGKTTRDEVAAQMSDYPVGKEGSEERAKLEPQQFRGGDWWLYVQRREEAKWVGVNLGYYDFGVETFGDVDYRFLLINFDKDDFVVGYQLSSSEGTGCNRHGVCTHRSHHTLLAPEDDDQAAKLFEESADGCGVYVYGKPNHFGYEDSAPSIWLDGRRVGWLMDKNLFYYLQIDEGAHQLAAHSMHDTNQMSIDLSCTRGDQYFFEVRHKGFFQGTVEIDIEQRDGRDGAKKVSARQLILTNIN